MVEEHEYRGGIRTVEKYVRSVKDKIAMNKKETCYLEIIRPMEEAQVDFGTFQYFNQNDVLVKGHHLCLSFPSSNACYWQAFHGENQECLLEGLQRIFEHIGGVPKRMVFDNMSSAVVSINKDDTRTLTPQFQKFMYHYGFKGIFCNPASGNEKGNVECNVGYQRRNMLVPVPKITNFKEFNKELFQRCEKQMYRNHYKRKERIIDLLEENIQKLKELPVHKFRVGRHFTVKTDGYSYFRFEGNRYSTRPGIMNKELFLHVSSESITVMDKDFKVIDTHPRIYGKQEEPITNWIHYINAIAKKPKAIKYSRFYNELSYEWKEYFETLSNVQCSEFLSVYGEYFFDERIETLTKTLRVMKSLNNNTLDAFTLQYRRLSDPIMKAQDVSYNSEIPTIKPYVTDFNKYNGFLGGER